MTNMDMSPAADRDDVEQDMRSWASREPNLHAAHRAYRVAAALEALTARAPAPAANQVSLSLALPKLRLRIALATPGGGVRTRKAPARQPESSEDDDTMALFPSGWWILPSAMGGAALWTLLLVGLFS